MDDGLRACKRVCGCALACREKPRRVCARLRVSACVRAEATSWMMVRAFFPTEDLI